jgi:6-phosphogluconolactonase/glucosamine-6-phosphate isomerase/deaminase
MAGAPPVLDLVHLGLGPEGDIASLVPGDPDRNLTHLRENLLTHAPLHPEQIHAMPVESGEFESACTRYTRTPGGAIRSSTWTICTAFQGTSSCAS